MWDPKSGAQGSEFRWCKITRPGSENSRSPGVSPAFSGSPLPRIPLEEHAGETPALLELRLDTLNSSWTSQIALINAAESATAPKTPPCIVTILRAAW
jgi:hypothetical protein